MVSQPKICLENLETTCLSSAESPCPEDFHLPLCSPVTSSKFLTVANNLSSSTFGVHYFISSTFRLGV